MDYGFFYDLAVYGNEAWKGSFTQKEIAINAFDYFYEYEESKKNKKLTYTISELFKLLLEDNSVESKDFGEKLYINLFPFMNEKEIEMFSLAFN